MIVVGEVAELDQVLSTSHHPQPDVLVLGLNVLPVPIIEVADNFGSKCQLLNCSFTPKRATICVYNRCWMPA